MDQNGETIKSGVMVYKQKVSGQVLNSRLTVSHFQKLMGKCRRILLTLLSSASQFQGNKKYFNFHTDIYTKPKTQGRLVNDL